MKFASEADYLEYWKAYTNSDPFKVMPNKLVQPAELRLDRLVAAEVHDYGDWGEFAVYEFEASNGQGGTVMVPAYNLGFKSWVEWSTDKETAVTRLNAERGEIAKQMAKLYGSTHEGPFASGYFDRTLASLESCVLDARALHHLIFSTSHTIESVDVSSLQGAVRKWFSDNAPRRFWGHKELDDHSLEWAAATLFWLHWKQLYRDKYPNAVWRKLADPSNSRLNQLTRKIWGSRALDEAAFQAGSLR